MLVIHLENIFFFVFISVFLIFQFFEFQFSPVRFGFSLLSLQLFTKGLVAFFSFVLGLYKAVVLHLWVPIPLGVIYQIPCLSDIYITIITIVKLQS